MISRDCCKPYSIRLAFLRAKLVMNAFLHQFKVFVKEREFKEIEKITQRKEMGIKGQIILFWESSYISNAKLPGALHLVNLRRGAVSVMKYMLCSSAPQKN